MVKYRRFSLRLVVLSTMLMVVGNISRAIANNSLFAPYLDQIRSQLAPGLFLRLPTAFPLTPDSSQPYNIGISPSLITPGITVSIFSCKSQSQSCLVGSIAVDSPSSSGDQEQLQLHRNSGQTLEISENIQGYLIIGQQQVPNHPLSSIMWEEDGLIYTVKLASDDPQKIMSLATATATATPIYSLNDPRSQGAVGTVETTNPEITVNPTPAEVKPEITTNTTNNTSVSANAETTAETEPTVVTPETTVETPTSSGTEITLSQAEIRQQNAIAASAANQTSTREQTAIAPLLNQIFFQPYINRVRDNLAPNLSIRLPVEPIKLDTNSQKPYLLDISPSLVTPGITVSIFDCEQKNQACLIGSVSVDSLDSQGDVQQLQLHQSQGESIAITNDLQGYALRNSQLNSWSSLPAIPSVMWEQDGLIYTVQLRTENKLLNLAKAVAIAQPIYRLDDPRYNIADDPEKTPITTQITPEQPWTPNPTSTPITITKLQINVTGNTVLAEQIASVVEPLQGKVITPDNLLIIQEEVKQLAADITGLYLQQGYINSFAKPVASATTPGAFEIQVIEGKITEICIQEPQQKTDTETENTPESQPKQENLCYLKDDENQPRIAHYVRDRLELVAINTPFSSADLEAQMRLLEQDPNIDSIAARITPTDDKKPGESKLEVTVKQKPPLNASVGVDNYISPSVGGERFGVNLGYGNLLKFGDEISASYFRSFEGGSSELLAIYQVPLNAKDGILRFRFDGTSTTIIEPPFDVLDIQADNRLYEVFYRQPLIKNSQQELALSLGFTFQNGQTFTLDLPTPFGAGPDEDGVSRTSVISFGQDYLRRDSEGAWWLRSQFNFGTGLFNATLNDPPIPDGQFFSWLGQAQRAQRLSANHTLVFQADLQLTPNSLLASQQFIIGGAQSVRGYRQNALSGDNGLRFSIEDRITIVRNKQGGSMLELIPFFDLGTVWNHKDNPNTLPDETFLMGTGLGLQWEALPGLTFRFDYGIPFTDLDQGEDDLQDHGFYFNVFYQIK